MLGVFRTVSSLLSLGICCGQSNLIPNSGFENGSPKPTNSGQIGNLDDWDNYGTSDWFYNGFFTDVDGPSVGAASSNGFVGFGPCEGVQTKLKEEIEVGLHLRKNNPVLELSYEFTSRNAVTTDLYTYLFKHKGDIMCDSADVDYDQRFSNQVVSSGASPNVLPDQWGSYVSDGLVFHKKKSFQYIAFTGEDGFGAYGHVNYLFLDNAVLTATPICQHRCASRAELEIAGGQNNLDNSYGLIINQNPWWITIRGAMEVDFRVYDRWGQVAFQHHAFDPNGLVDPDPEYDTYPIAWNGNHNSDHSLPIGVYVYHLEAWGCKGRDIYETRSITIAGSISPGQNSPLGPDNNWLPRNPFYELRREFDNQCRDGDNLQGQNWSANLRAAQIGDFDGDGSDQVFLQNIAASNSNTFLMDNIQEDVFDELDITDKYWMASSKWSAQHRIAHVGDFNGDGSQDILLQNKAPSGHATYLLLAQGNGDFHHEETISDRYWMNTGKWADQYRKLHVGDFNGDGSDDLLLQNRDASGHATYLLLADGNGEFHHEENLSNRYWMNTAKWADQYRQLHVGDFNGDGNDDLILQNKAVSGHATYLLLADGSGGFHNEETITNRYWMSSSLWADYYRKFHVGDFNGDGFDDILLQSRYSTSHGTYILFSDGQGGFSNRKFITYKYGMNYSKWGANKRNLLVGDFNGDGAHDLVLIAKSRGDKSYLLLADQGAEFHYVNDITHGTSYTQMNGEKWAQDTHIALVADFNGDGYDEIFLQGKTESDAGAVVYFSKNIATMATVQASSTFSGYSAARTNDGDVNDSLGKSHSWANTGYCPSAQPWVELSWNVPQMFNGLNVVTTKTYPLSQYDIRYWNNDTENWVVLLSTSGNTKSKSVHRFPPVTTTKIRIVTKRGPSHQAGYCRINELEVFGMAAP